VVFYFKKMKKINKFLRKNLPARHNWFKLKTREMTFVNSLAVLADQLNKTEQKNNNN